MSNELLEYINLINKQAEEWMNAAPGRGIGLFTTDMDHWASIGVHTVAQFKRYQLECEAWDLYKEAYGVRPRGILNDMTDDELSDYVENLYDEVERENRYLEERQNEAAVEFEEKVAELIKCGAGDRATAIRWMQDADDYTRGDDRYFEYVNDLPYHYLDRT